MFLPCQHDLSLLKIFDHMVELDYSELRPLRQAVGLGFRAVCRDEL